LVLLQPTLTLKILVKSSEEAFQHPTQQEDSVLLLGCASPPGPVAGSSAQWEELWARLLSFFPGL